MWWYGNMCDTQNDTPNCDFITVICSVLSSSVKPRECDIQCMSQLLNTNCCWSMKAAWPTCKQISVAVFP